MTTIWSTPTRLEAATSIGVRHKELECESRKTQLCRRLNRFAVLLLQPCRPRMAKESGSATSACLLYTFRNSFCSFSQKGGVPYLDSRTTSAQLQSCKRADKNLDCADSPQRLEPRPVDAQSEEGGDREENGGLARRPPGL